MDIIQAFGCDLASVNFTHILQDYFKMMCMFHDMYFKNQKDIF